MFEKEAEQLADKVIVKEAVSKALKQSGFLKLADNAWLSPLIGAGLGAAGGGLTNYLTSTGEEDPAEARKRMLKHVLTGAGAGGLAGYGFDVLRKKTPTPDNFKTDKRLTELADTMHEPVSEGKRTSTGYGLPDPNAISPGQVGGYGASGFTGYLLRDKGLLGKPVTDLGDLLGNTKALKAVQAKRTIDAVLKRVVDPRYSSNTAKVLADTIKGQGTSNVQPTDLRAAVDKLLKSKASVTKLLKSKLPASKIKKLVTALGGEGNILESAKSLEGMPASAGTRLRRTAGGAALAFTPLDILSRYLGALSGGAK